MAGLDHQDGYRPLSTTTFRRDLDRFQRYIAEVTLQDSDKSVEEKRAKINETLRYEAFCEKVRIYFGPDIKSDDIKAIFRKICANPEMKIEWSEIFGYFQAESRDGEMFGDDISVFLVSKRKKIGEAAGDKRRRDIIQCITYSAESDIYVTASQKGALSIYNGKLRLQSCIDVNEPAWITSCGYLPKLRKIIATTERTIVIWDHRAKVNMQCSLYIIKPLEHSPQCLCLLPTKDEHRDSVLIGDDAGYVNLVKLTPQDFASNNNDNSNKDTKKTIASQVIDPGSLLVPLVRRKFHPDWVLKIEYVPDIKSFASCSPSDRTSFVISNVKRIHDNQPFSELSIVRGVNSFAYSEKSNIFATGGVDKIVRVWHPNILSRPTGKMTGHLFTIIAVVINDKDQHIISLSTARVFRVWDIHTLSCLQVFTDTEQKYGDTRISCMLFDSRHDRLFTGSSSIDMWPMTRTVQDIMSVPHTHDQPISVVAKNALSSHILTACSESIIKVWEVNSGRQVYQIMGAHGLGVEITAACIDPTGAYIATGAYDGSIKIWEFSSGQELKDLSANPTSEEDQAILWISYLNSSHTALRQNEGEHRCGAEGGKGSSAMSKRHILAVGWNNKIIELEECDENDEIKIARVCDSACKVPDKNSPGRNSEDNIIVHKEMTCCSLVDECLSSAPMLVLIGCSDGSTILWNYRGEVARTIIQLGKNDFPRRYETCDKNDKETYPCRVNAVGELSHSIFRPDPNEIRQRQKVSNKKVQQMEGGTDNGENFVKNPTVMDENDCASDDELHVEIKASKDKTNSEDIGMNIYGEFDKARTKMVRVDFPTIIVSCHQDSNVRLWSMEGDLILTLLPATKVASPITAMTRDEHSNTLLVADSKGFITMWDVSDFLEQPIGSSFMADKELARQVITWRAHLMKIVALAYAEESGCLISSSTDGSVRVWYPEHAHFVGYFGQHRVWNITQSPTLPLRPILPYDISEGPAKPPNIRSGRKRTRAKKYDCPLVFDDNRWKPFRRSAYDREIKQRGAVSPEKFQTANAVEVKNKKFFEALIKPKVDKSNMDSSKPAEPESGAIFRALPVYHLETPPYDLRIPSMEVIMGRSSCEEIKFGKTCGNSSTGAKLSKGHPYAKRSTNQAAVVFADTANRRR